MEEELPYKFISNTPIGKDLFEGKSQEKIAKILSEILTKDDFQIIGIDGSWGTGKSNLVKITQEKLEKSNYHFFIYDVWGHQEDDQRKSILVELTEFISDKNKNIVNNKTRWHLKLKKLLSKEKEITTINIPYLSVGFIFSLFSIIYVPTVNVFKDEIIVGVDNLFLRLLLILFPVLIVTGIYLYNFGKNLVYKKGWDSFKLASQETFQIYNNKQKEETKIETISENDPSVKDFRSWMRDIDNDLNENKLVVVFDNFDRLPRKHILSIWSSIHIFFSEDKYKNIKVIIPFDRLHIKNAFKELNGENGNFKLDYADDYINKTFDLVYRVSPPILSDWKNFFRNCWKNAYVNFSEEEYLKVEQCYETFRNTITPREIIAFVNETVSIRLLDNIIPDRYIALFVLNKDEILEDPLKAITESGFLSGLSYLYKDDEDFQKYITSLAYQIDSKNALEVVYRKQLKDVLVNKKIDSFKDIAKTEIFNKIIMSVFSELEDLENPVIVLNALDSESKISLAEKQTLWDDIYFKMKNQNSEEKAIKEFHKTILTNISNVYKKSWLEKLISHVDVIDANFDEMNYCNSIDDLNSTCEKHSLEIDVFTLIKTNIIEPSKFLSVVKNKKEKYSNYKITTNESDLNKLLSNTTDEELKELHYLGYIKNSFNLTSFLSYLKDRINKNKDDLDVLNNIYKLIRTISNSKIGILLDDSEIYNLYDEVDVELDFYYDLIAMRLARADKFTSSFSSTFDDILEEENAITVDKVCERIYLYVDYDDLLINSVSFSESFLYKNVVKKLVTDNSDYYKRANIKELLVKFDDICEKNELLPQDFINDLNTFWEDNIIDSGTLKSLSINYFQEAKTNVSKLAKESIELINNFYDGLIKEDWIKIFDKNEKEFKIIQVIEYNNWNSFSLEALKETFISKVKSSDFDDLERFTYILSSFESSGKDLTSTFKDVRDEFIDSRNINLTAFIFFEKWLFKYSHLEERANDVLRTIFKTDFLDNVDYIKILTNNIDTIKQLTSNSSNSNSSDFRAGIRDRIDNNDDISNLAKSLGIRKSNKEDKN